MKNEMSEDDRLLIGRVLGTLPIITGAVERAERAARYLRDRGTVLSDEDRQMLTSALADIRDAIASESETPSEPAPGRFRSWSIGARTGTLCDASAPFRRD